MPKHELLKEMEEKRKKLDLSKEKFAVRKLGVSHNTYYRWFNKRFNPDLETIEQIQQVVEDGEPRN